MENEEQALAGKKEQGMSYREFELVQEYAKAKLEAQSELQYEDLSDYEIPPRTQFSMLKKPAVSIKYKEITHAFREIRYLLNDSDIPFWVREADSVRHRSVQKALLYHC